MVLQLNQDSTATYITFRMATAVSKHQGVGLILFSLKSPSLCGWQCYFGRGLVIAFKFSGAYRTRRSLIGIITYIDVLEKNHKEAEHYMPIYEEMKASIPPEIEHPTPSATRSARAATVADGWSAPAMGIEA